MCIYKKQEEQTNVIKNVVNSKTFFIKYNIPQRLILLGIEPALTSWITNILSEINKFNYMWNKLNNRGKTLKDLFFYTTDKIKLNHFFCIGLQNYSHLM